jgi:CHASE2 domain-containing sensor protein
MSNNPPKPNFRQYILWGLFWMAVCELIHLGLQQTPFYRQLENANLDALLAASNAPALSGKDAKEVFVVVVNDIDFQDPAMFAGVSPLNPKKLAEVVEAVIASGPASIGVDFDTSLWDASFRKSPVLLRKDIPVVWARAAVVASEGEGPSRKLNIGEFNESDGVCYGVPAYFPDEDGLIREYQQRLRIKSDEFFPSLSFNLTKVTLNHGSCAQSTFGPKPPKDAGIEPQLIGYHGGSPFGHLSAGALLKLAPTPGWVDHNPLKGKVVLLGGAYREARDYYPTPIGYLPGVDILAHSVRSQLPGGELTHGPAWNLALGYFEGVLLLVAFYCIPLRWALLVTLLAGPVYGVLVNWMAFHWHGAFLSFVPSFVGLLIFKCVEYAREHRRLHEENNRLTDELEKLRSGKTHRDSRRLLRRT